MCLGMDFSILLFFKYFLLICYYSFPSFSPLSPLCPAPQLSSILPAPPYFMSMGCTYKFFESSVSHTIFYLSPSILCLLIMLLLPCTFSPYSSLPPPHWNPPMWCPFLWFCSCSSCLRSFFCFHHFSFLLGSFVDSCELVVILLFIFFIFFLDKSV